MDEEREKAAKVKKKKAKCFNRNSDLCSALRGRRSDLVVEPSSRRLFV